MLLQHSAGDGQNRRIERIPLILRQRHQVAGEDVQFFLLAAHLSGRLTIRWRL